MMLFALLSSFVFFTYISCDFSHLYINEPNTGISWRPGSNVAIKWASVGGSLPQDAKLSIDIMDGSAQSANLVAHVGNNIPSSVTQYNWVVPVNMEQRSDYFIRMSSSDTSGVSYFYSGRYAVSGEAMGATLVSQPWEATTTPTSTAKPTRSSLIKPTTAPSTSHTEHTSSSSEGTSTSAITSNTASSTVSKQESTTTTLSTGPRTTTTSSQTTGSTTILDDQSSADSSAPHFWTLVFSAITFFGLFLVGAAV